MKPNLSRLISPSCTRRDFLRDVTLAGAGALTLPRLGYSQAAGLSDAMIRPEYRGPNVVIIRYGGGARRRESIDPEHTFSPFLCHELTRRGTLFPNMEISQFVPMTVEHADGKREQLETSHGQGTLYIITGKYERFQDVHYHHPDMAEYKFLGARFESQVPTLFEYLRKSYNIPGHQTLIVNSEDRGDEEFYNFSNHHLFGVQYRSNTLSLRRFKAYLIRRDLGMGRYEGKELEKKRKELAEMESLDFRDSEKDGQPERIESFWEDWRTYYGNSGLVNPRGDRLLTELTIRAMKQLRPKLVMVNYTDCDYVHWGYMNHYTRAISIMDHGIKQLVQAVEADEAYRDNTVFVIVPDCGRDNNPLVAVPCQHHFNTRSAREIFCLMFGPGIEQGVVVDKPVNQVQVAATIGQVMQFKTEHAEGAVLEEAFA